MFNKISTKHLFIVFFVLLAFVLITVPSGNSKKSRSFNSELTNIDTSTVYELLIYPKGGGELLTFTKEGNNWKVSDKQGKYNADKGQVKNMLAIVSKLKAKRLAATDKESWGKYELTDSLSTRVEIRYNKKDVDNVYIGKFSYTQPSQPTIPYQQPRGTMSTYVRVNSDKKVYNVDGFLSMSFSNSVTNYRDSRIVEVKKENIKQIQINRPEGSYMLAQNNNVWSVDGLTADSASVATYLSSLQYLKSTSFIGENQKPVGNSDYNIKIEGENGLLYAQVEAFYTDSTQIVVHSSLNQGTYFDGAANELFNKLFREKSVFVQ